MTDLVVHPSRKQLEAMRHLVEGWDGQDAPPPNREALDYAQEIVRWALQQGLVITEVDADVLGGVAIWMAGQSGTTAWVACMNNGAKTLVLTENGDVNHSSWTDLLTTRSDHSALGILGRNSTTAGQASSGRARKCRGPEP